MKKSNSNLKKSKSSKKSVPKKKSTPKKKSINKPVGRIGILKRLKNKRVNRLQMRLKKLSLID